MEFVVSETETYSNELSTWFITVNLFILCIDSKGMNEYRHGNTIIYHYKSAKLRSVTP